MTCGTCDVRSAQALRILSNVDVEVLAADAERALVALAPEQIELTMDRLSLRQGVWALPILDGIVARFPRARVVVSAEPPLAALVSEHLNLRDRPGRPGGAVTRVSLTGLQSTGAMLTIVLRPSRRPQHACADGLDAALVAGVRPRMAVPRLHLRRETIRRARLVARQFAAGPHPLILLASRGVHPTPRSFGVDAYARLASALRESLSARCVSIVHPIPGTEFWDAMPHPHLFAAISRFSAAVVGDDCGATHLAAAAGARVVSLHGSNAPWRTGPVSESATALHHDRCHCNEPVGRGARGCLMCLPVFYVQRVVEEAAARSWPWDRLRMVMPWP